MKKYLSLFAIIIISSTLVVGVVSAATTISNNISTGGTLSVTGTSTLATTTFSGNVGIGTTTSSNLLEVNGTIGTIGLNYPLNYSSALSLNLGTFSSADQVGTIIMRFNGPCNKIIFGGDNSVSEITTLRGCARPLYLNSNGYSTTSAFVAIMTNGFVGIGTTTPSSQLQVTSGAATTTVTIGKVGAGKGSCLELYDDAGAVVYAHVAPGATTFTLSTVSCK